MILTQIKKDRMVANKEGNKQKYETLTTLLSEVQRLDKPDQEDDAKVQAVCKKYVKGLDEMVVAHTLKGIDTLDTNTTINNLSLITDEKKIVESYLPKQLSEAELTKTIDELIYRVGATTKKDMGKVMKALKEKHDGQYDGKLASQLVRELLK